jgi:hypothetical protein
MNLEKVTKLLKTIEKEKLDEFLVLIVKRLNPNATLNLLFELNKYLTFQYRLSKENQIILYFFLSFLTKYSVNDNCSITILDEKIKLIGNSGLSSLITNISGTRNVSSNFRLITGDTFLLIYSNETPNYVLTSILNKKKFNTFDTFKFLSNNYKYEFVLTKAVKQPLHFLYLAFKYYATTNSSNPVIENYIKVILEDFLGKLVYIP